jgi:hypothetical protein
MSKNMHNIIKSRKLRAAKMFAIHQCEMQASKQQVMARKCARGIENWIGKTYA